MQKYNFVVILNCLLESRFDISLLKILIDWMEAFAKLASLVCRGGGTGRRARLKIWWWQHRVGSIPTLGTNTLQDVSCTFPD